MTAFHFDVNNYGIILSEKSADCKKNLNISCRVLIAKIESYTENGPDEMSYLFTLN